MAEVPSTDPDTKTEETPEAKVPASSDTKPDAGPPSALVFDGDLPGGPDLQAEDRGTLGRANIGAEILGLPDKDGPPDTLDFVQEPTLEDQFGALGKTAVRGAVTGGAVFQGAVRGAQLASKIPVPHPFARGLTVLGGTIIGGGIGMFVGETANDQLEKVGLSAKPEDLPEELRPMGFVGEALGAGLAGLGTTSAFAFGKGALRLGDTFVAQRIKDVLNIAKTKPLRFAAGETFLLGQAAIAEGVVATLTDNQWARTGTGIVVGIANPVRRVAQASTFTARQLFKLVRKWGSGGRLNAAGDSIVKFVNEADGDPDKLMDMIARASKRGDTIPGFRATAGQSTGDVPLMQLEAELARKDEIFGAEISQRAQDSLDAIASAIEVLRETGDAFALRAVVEIRRARYQSAFDRLMAHAKADAVALAVKAGDTGIDNRAKLSTQIKEVYIRAIERARVVERSLWDKALPNPETPYVPRMMFRLEANLKGDLHAAGKLPQEIADQLFEVRNAINIFDLVEAGEEVSKEAVKKAQRTLSIGELQRFRSEMLTLARGQARSTDPRSDQLARRFGLMAEAMLDDLVAAGEATRRGADDSLRGAGGKFVTDETDFDIARKFSKFFNTAFENIGQLSDEGAHGLRVPPEALMTRMFPNLDEVAELRLKELTEIIDATRMFDITGAPALNADIGLMYDLQSRVLRIFVDEASTDVVNPITGEVTRRLSLSKARAVLKSMKDTGIAERFSIVMDDLEGAVASENTLKVWGNRVAAITTGEGRLGPKSAFARVLAVESPADAVAGAVNSLTPVERLDDMAKLAFTVDDLPGFRAAIWDFVTEQARKTPDRSRSLGILVDTFDKPMRPGLPSLREFMVTRGLMPPEVAVRIDELVDVAENITAAIGTQSVGAEITQATDMITNLLLRVGGSMVGRGALRKIQGGAAGGAGPGGPTLIMAQRASQASQDLLDRIPTEKLLTFIKNALKGDPIIPSGLLARTMGAPAEDSRPWSLLKLLMEKGGAGQEELVKVRRLHAYLWQAGLLGIEDQTEDVSPEAPSQENIPIPPQLEFDESEVRQTAPLRAQPVSDSPTTPEGESAFSAEEQSAVDATEGEQKPGGEEAVLDPGTEETFFKLFKQAMDENSPAGVRSVATEKFADEVTAFLARGRQLIQGTLDAGTLAEQDLKKAEAIEAEIVEIEADLKIGMAQLTVGDVNNKTPLLKHLEGMDERLQGLVDDLNEFSERAISRKDNARGTPRKEENI